MKKIDSIVLILLVVGGLNWGLWGVFNFNLVDYVFSRMWMDRVIYFLVGVASVYALLSWKIFRVKLGKKR
jgi:uncharacterized protein